MDVSHEPWMQVTNGVSCVFPRGVTIYVYFVTYYVTNYGCESHEPGTVGLPMRNMTHYIKDMTYAYTRHDSFICET